MASFLPVADSVGLVADDNDSPEIKTFGVVLRIGRIVMPGIEVAVGALVRHEQKLNAWGSGNRPVACVGLQVRAKLPAFLRIGIRVDKAGSGKIRPNCVGADFDRVSVSKSTSARIGFSGS